MSKFKTRYINYSDRSFKKKFKDLIYDERKSNDKINITVTKIFQTRRTGSRQIFIILKRDFLISKGRENAL